MYWSCLDAFSGLITIDFWQYNGPEIYQKNETYVFREDKPLRY
jgi:hypothetical protein